MPFDEYVPAGKITTTHGVKGDIKIDVWLDSPEYFCDFDRIFFGSTKKEYKITSARVHKNAAVIHLDGFDDMDSVLPLKGTEVFVLREDAGLDENECFIQDIMGADVVDEDGNKIGTLDDVLEYPTQRVFVVGKHLIPDVQEFIRNVDAEKGVITVRLIEGL